MAQAARRMRKAEDEGVALRLQRGLCEQRPLEWRERVVQIMDSVIGSVTPRRYSFPKVGGTAQLAGRRPGLPAVPSERQRRSLGRRWSAPHRR